MITKPKIALIAIALLVGVGLGAVRTFYITGSLLKTIVIALTALIFGFTVMVCTVVWINR